MKKMFPKYARNIIVDKARNVFEIAVSLHNKGHRSIIMVVGSDRVAEFDKLLNTYNGVEADTVTTVLTISKLYLLEKEMQIQMVFLECLHLR